MISVAGAFAACALSPAASTSIWSCSTLRIIPVRVNVRRPAGTNKYASALRFVVHSGFTETAGEAVEDRLHDVLEKSALSGLDVNVGRHSRRRDEFRHPLDNIIFIQAHPNHVEFPTRVTSGFGIRLHLFLQSVR